MIRIAEADVIFETHPFITPLRLSSGTIDALTEARAEVAVDAGGKRAVGRGSIFLSDPWAWPDPEIPHEERDAILRSFCRFLAADLKGEAEHPLSLGLQLHQSAHENSPPDINRDIPILARSMCASPFDAAIHDAVGQALGVSAFSLYRDDVPVPESDGIFKGNSTTTAIRSLLRKPAGELSAWYIAGAGPDAEAALQKAVREHGFYCFKIKTMGTDPEEDAAHTGRIFRAALEAGVEKPILTVDSNQAHPDAQSVLSYLVELESHDAEAYASLSYIEQPTNSDIVSFPQNWKTVAARKPVLLDEGLTGFDILPAAKEQGWSGLALKTCKGHSFALAAAAWAKENGMGISLQDLTNPGLSAIHAALFASYVPTINGVELNSMQFAPAANQEWLPRLNELLSPSAGMHRIAEPHAPGLGSNL